MKNMNVKHDDGSFALDYPDYIDNYVMTASTAQAITIPTSENPKFAVFSCNKDFYIDYSGTAAVPSADVTDGTGVELNPTVRWLGSLSSISAISEEDAILTIAYYSLG